MKRRTMIANGIRAASGRIAPRLLLGPCLLFAARGIAQTSVNPLHAMSPAQQQHAMFGSRPALPPAKNIVVKPATPPTPANEVHEGIQAHGRWTMKTRKTRSSPSERRGQ